MRLSFKKGFSFGLTSGIITTLGLIVGLEAGTNSKAIILGGILTIAVADAFSDALGVHLSEESENQHSQKEIWESTVATFLSKFIFALTFIVPFLIFTITTAVYICIIWGVLLLTLLSINIARQENKKTWSVASEHLLITALVIILTHFLGDWINNTLK
jgi:VIT1/CCC1 family predicted Fe2+/Mn2+ transporter